MIKFKQFLLVGLIITTAFFTGCSPKMYTTQYTKSPVVQLASDIQPTQTQGGIVVEMKPLDVNKEYEKPIYNQPINVTYTPVLSNTPVTEKKDNQIGFFYKLTPFSVTITNNTDHILRMKDSRVIFIDPKVEEPIMPINKERPENYSDMRNQFPIFDLEVSTWKKAYPMTATLEIDITRAITNILQQIKFINGFNTEIMPGMKYSGILLFPINPEKLSEGKISFIDMISKVDAAGNTTEKVRFDYKTNVSYAFSKSDPNTGKWIKINEDDYNKGLTSPEQYYYDSSQKKWVSGAPPKK